MRWSEDPVWRRLRRRCLSWERTVVYEQDDQCQEDAEGNELTGFGVRTHAADEAKWVMAVGVAKEGTAEEQKAEQS